MSYWLQTLLNNVKVVQTKTGLQVLGIRTKLFLKELKRVYGTSRFENGMLTRVTSTSFHVSRFFLYDFYDLMIDLSGQGTRYYRQDIVIKLTKELEKIPEIEQTHRVFPSKLNRSQLKRFEFTPLPSQEEFFDIYDQKTQQYNLNGYILAAPPGSGKTAGSLMLQAMLDKDIVIIFSPNNALNEVWKATLEKVKDAVTWVYPQPMDNKPYTHYVFSHENTKYAKEVLPTIFRKRHNANIGIILDECHRFTELNAAQTNNIIEICELSESKDILFMSGTPFKALGTELIPFLLSTDPTFTPEDQLGFRKIFGVSSSAGRAILAARIGRVLFKVEKSAVVNNDVTTYVVKVRIKDSVQFTLDAIKHKMQIFVRDRLEYYKKEGPKLIAEYNRILDVFSRTPVAQKNIKDFMDYKKLALVVRNSTNLRDVKDEIKATNQYEKNVIIPQLSSNDKASFKNVKSIYKYLPLKIQGEALGQVLGKMRSECNVAIMKNINNGHIYSDKGQLNGEEWDLDDIFMMSKTKVVMFTDFIEVLKQAETTLKKNGYQPALVYGDTNKDLSNIIKRVETDPEVNPIVATFKSLSTAVPLIFSDTVVLLNVPYRDYIYQQTIARVDRLGQKHPVHIYQYQLDTDGIPNISTRSHDIMAWSKKMVDELLGIVSSDEDVLDEEVTSVMESFEQRSLISQWTN